MKFALPWIAFFTLSHAEPLKLLVIGDSQSEEYAFEVPFSAPNSNPIRANTQNWIEVLNERRPDEVTFGSYADTILSYPDLRNGGFELNWGVPGAETETWAKVVTASLLDEQLLLTSKFKLIEQLPGIDATVIILGGNDANSEYRNLYHNTPSADWQSDILANLTTIIDFVQSWSNKPILLANIPDVGATRLVIGKFPDPEKRTTATGYIQQANTAIAQLAVDQNVTLINFFSITEQLTQDGPIRIGNIEFFPFAHPENTPRHLLCKDGFHPSTATQCLLANLVLEGLSFSPLSNTEILQETLDIPINTDDAYLTWISNSTTDTSFLSDPDGDGLPNLGEYALGKNPTQSDAPLFEFSPVINRVPYVTTLAKRSENLIDWLPADQNSSLPFFRLEFDLKR